MKKFFITFILIITSVSITYQSKAAEFDFGADIMNRYVWRGRDYGNSPNIQPYIEYKVGGFTAGTWGAFSIDTDVYQELDLYVNYNIADIITLGITDYFFPLYQSSNSAFKTNYFNYNSNNTDHIIEGNLIFHGLEKFPISLAAHIAFYGDDKNPEGAQLYSTYFEAGYSGTLNDTDFIVYVGLTPEKGLYGEKFGFVNIGLNLMREIRITDSFSLPVVSGLIFNTLDENAFLIFGISL